MGPIGVAYYDTESFQLNPPSSWNSGWTYRNDGVDIENFYDQVNDNGYKVGFIDTDDWMNYTVNVAEDSVYTINVRQGCSGSTGGNFYFEADGVRITPNYYATVQVQLDDILAREATRTIKTKNKRMIQRLTSIVNKDTKPCNTVIGQIRDKFGHDFLSIRPRKADDGNPSATLSAGKGKNRIHLSNPLLMNNKLCVH